ncbi:MAG: glycosyltransferase [Balneolaceae bacterium]
MDILIVSNHFYPQSTPRAFRTTELAKELAKQGHLVTVIVPKDEEIHHEFEQKYNVKIEDLGSLRWHEIQPNGNKIVKFGKLVLKRISEQFLYYPQIQLKCLVKKALKKHKEKEYDALISIAAPHPIHWGVADAIKDGMKPAKKWIADCGDPFMLSGNIHYNRPFYFKYLEKKFCRLADAITVPFEGAKEGYYKEFGEKLHVIPQGFNFTEFPEIKNKQNEHEVPTFAYAGSLNLKRRNPSQLLDYLLKKRVPFKFYLYTNNILLVQEYANDYPDKVILRGYKPRAELLEELSEMDFVLNFENQGSTQLPSKLIDYAILEKPILSIKFDDLDTELVDQFLNGNYSNSISMGDVDEYRIESVTDKFISLIESGK